MQSSSRNLNALSSIRILEVKKYVYNLYAWADSFSSDGKMVPFYNVENLNSIYFEVEGYGNVGISSKTACYVSLKDVTIDGEKINLEMKTPHAGYELVMQNPSAKLGKTGKVVEIPLEVE